MPGGIAWTAVRARPRWGGETDGPALCLHRADALPYAPEHPWLAPGHAPLPLAVPSVTAAGEGWRLHVADGKAADVAEPKDRAAGWQARLAVPEGTALLLATPRPGMRVAPAGMTGGRKTLGDFFTDRKVTPALRAGWPLVVDRESGAVLWVCGLGVMEARAGRAVDLWWEREA
jgi:tRNA(Ile)-lysidine synthetase-like protein